MRATPEEIERWTAEAREACLNPKPRYGPWFIPTGEQIKKLRERLEVTRSDFAVEFNIPLAALCKWEEFNIRPTMEECPGIHWANDPRHPHIVKLLHARKQQQYKSHA